MRLPTVVAGPDLRFRNPERLASDISNGSSFVGGHLIIQAAKTTGCVVRDHGWRGPRVTAISPPMALDPGSSCPSASL